MGGCEPVETGRYRFSGWDGFPFWILSHFTSSAIIIGTSWAGGGVLEDCSGCGIGNVVLHFAIVTRIGGAASDTFDQLLMDFADHSLGDGVSCFKGFGDELKGIPIVEEFPPIIGIDLREVFTPEQLSDWSIVS